MNETLRRALLQARLTEEDVAAHLQVDPKTVRRWLEGRTPYLRHRWALAVLLGLDEADLWPQLCTARPQHEEVRAIYPHRGSIPSKVWQEFFGSAQYEIGMLADCGPSPTDDRGILSVLRNRVEAGVKLLICLRAPSSPELEHTQITIRDTLVRGDQPNQIAQVEIRLHRLNLQNTIYRADDELIVGLHAFGIPTSTAPALRLHGDGSSAGVVATYLESFHQAWADSESVA